VRKAIETLGSQYINNVGYRESWCMIGRKGAAKGSVPEVYKKIYEGQAIIEMNRMIPADSGTVILPAITNSAKWKDVTVSKSIPAGAQLLLFPIVEKSDGKTDTLQIMDLKDSTKSLTSIDASIYPHLRFKVKMIANSDKESPTLKSVGVNFTSVPELATNYQVVSIAKDTLEQGETANLSFKVYNVGESRAENFKTNVEIVKKDNSRDKIFEQVVDSIGADKYKQFNVNYNTSNVTGVLQFNINIDPENKITELYKDNNFYSVPIFVRSNTKPAAVKLTFDGSDIIDGDFISPKPNIRVELNDQSLIPVQDTSAIQLFLNNKKISIRNNPALSYSFAASNPKFIIDYQPVLGSGAYNLKVVWKNATGTIIDTAGIVRKFSVHNDLQIFNVYNFPNPFSDQTYFTFKLTQIPDELKINIYTLTGRMIKQFNLTASELRYDFNKIFWDGKDNDGDLIANGVYFYKIISKKGSESIHTTQKLAIVR